jgi:hypothetical protein
MRPSRYHIRFSEEEQDPEAHNTAAGVVAIAGARGFPTMGLELPTALLEAQRPSDLLAGRGWVARHRVRLVTAGTTPASDAMPPRVYSAMGTAIGPALPSVQACHGAMRAGWRNVDQRWDEQGRGIMAGTTKEYLMLRGLWTALGPNVPDDPAAGSSATSGSAIPAGSGGVRIAGGDTRA